MINNAIKSFQCTDCAKSFVMLSPMQMTAAILSHPKNPTEKDRKKNGPISFALG